MTDRTSLRLAATLIFLGTLLSLLAGLLHPDRQPANSHVATFAEYANSAYWTGIHLGQFVGMAVFIAGLLALFYALNVTQGRPGWVNRYAAVATVVALALYGVLQAVDGVALKQAVNAWTRAPDVEKTARFASAETIRWLEWGVRSYQSFMLGVALILFGVVIASTARIPRLLGYLMGLSGVAYIWQGWVIGTQGFSDANSTPTLLGIISIIVWSIWLLVSAWRMKQAISAPAHLAPDAARG
jgi:hypothetical protein